MSTTTEHSENRTEDETTGNHLPEVAKSISPIDRTTSVTPNPEITEDKVVEEPMRNQEEEEEEEDGSHTPPLENSDDIIENEASRDAEDSVKQIILERSSTLKGLLNQEGGGPSIKKLGKESEKNNDDSNIDENGDEEMKEEEEEVEGVNEEEEEEDDDNDIEGESRTKKGSKQSTEETSLNEAEREKRRARFDFIIQQAELYNNFKDPRGFLKKPQEGREDKDKEKQDVCSGDDKDDSASNTKSKNKLKGKKGKKSKIKTKDEDEEVEEEEEEDAAMVEDALEEGGSSIVRHYEQSPPFINGTLKPYQIIALNWLISRHDAGLSGILADEMGLGKTLESISILAYLSQVRGVKRPYLVLAPKSTLFNWTGEFAKWTPFFRVCRFHGDKATRQALIHDVIAPGRFDVVVTSYEVVCIEKAALSKHRWKYIVIDEAHRIKNEHSRLSCVVRRLYSEHRLLLTGTPLQNNLHELWALLNFLVPEVFSSSDDFDEWFKLEGSDGERQRETVEKLHRVLRPFLLRRLKAEVAKALPPKKEVKLFVGMTAMQTEWYRKVLMKDFSVVTGADGVGGGSSSNSNNTRARKVQLLNIIMQLRKVCDHPYLFEGAEKGHEDGSTGEDIVSNAGKMIVLDKLLGRLQAQGSRVLIFSQMTRMLDILEDYLYMREYSYARIDGSTGGEERDAQIAAFNRAGSDVFAFLLSTRAGGLGINLATADTVILYDSDWNPQVDLQAQDRAHRIGQTRPVNVYRFVTEGSVEMKIVQRAEKKLQLDALVIQQGRLTDQQRGKAGGASGEELLSMIRFGADAIFKAKNGTFEDSDIDLILRRGEEQTAALSATLKAQAALLTFSSADGNDNNNDEENNVDDYLSWDGVNWRKERAKFSATKLLADLPKRERPQSFAENLMFQRSQHALQQQQGQAQQQPQVKLPRPPKQHILHDFQFFPHRLVELLEKERAAYLRKREDAEHGKEPDPAGYGELTGDEEAEKEALLKQGWTNWNRREYQAFVRGCEKYGRSAFDKIAVEIRDSGAGVKTPIEIKAYSEVFWARWREMRDGERAVKAIERGEEKLKRSERFLLALEKKAAACSDPKVQLRIHTKTGRQEASFTEEEDGMILYGVWKIGELGKWDEVLRILRAHPPFRFDWFIRSRSPGDIARRADTLLRMVEREQNAGPLQESTEKSKTQQKKKKVKNTASSTSQLQLSPPLKKTVPKKRQSDPAPIDKAAEPKLKRQKKGMEENEREATANTN